MSMEELAVLSLQIKEIMTRLKRIETHLSLGPAPVTVSPTQTMPPNPSFDDVVASRREAPAAPKVEVQGTTPQSSAGNLLGIIASICFVLAGIYIVKLAIDQGWLTPFRQVGLAALFSLLLIGTGLVLRKKDNDYAGFLPACGVILLYADSYGAYQYYGLTNFTGAVAGACATSLISLWLFARFRTDIYAVLSAVGSYTLPLLLPELRANVSLISIYFLVFSLLSSVISVFLESRVLPLVSAYLGIGVLAACALSSQDANSWSLAAFVQLLQFVFFVGSAVYYSMRNRAPLSETEAWSYFPLLLFFYATEYSLFMKFIPSLAPWISLGFAAFVFFVYQLSKKELQGQYTLQSGLLVVTFCSVVLFHSGYLVLLPDELKPILFFAFLFSAPMLLKGTNEQATAAKLRKFLVPALAVFLICCIEYGKIALGLFSNGDMFFVLKGLICALGIIWLYRRSNLGDASHPLLVAAHLQSILALYRLVHESGSIAVSLAWGAYALSVLAVSFYIRDKTLGRSSAVVLSVAAAKVLLYDTSSAAPDIRIICLIMTGVLLYLSGFLFKRIAEWK